MKKKKAYVVGKINGKIWNKFLQYPDKSQHVNLARQHRQEKKLKSNRYIENDKKIVYKKLIEY